MRLILFTFSIILTTMTTNQAQEPTKSLKECPSSPNCVSSTTKSEDHYMEPIQYKGDIGLAKENLMKVLDTEKRVSVTQDTDSYVKSEFKIALFGFVDDVEFLFDDTNKKIHFRSASRVGYSDFGVNKKRMIRIKRAFVELDNSNL